MNLFHLALKPLRHYADFHGRSTRTELILFYIFTQLLTVLVDMASVLTGLPDMLAGDLVSLALLCPRLALWVRRLHDTGRSGWWALLALPPAAAGLWQRYMFSQDPFDFSRTQLSWSVGGPAVLFALALLFLLLRDDEEEANAYGPNPRYDAADPLTDPAGEPA